jgi:Alcohol dehydrogenase GroES-associated/Alcohol dehydrogenase GroES-like domain
MRALCWHGKGDIRCDTVPDPKIEAPGDAIIKIRACAICGSDLHLLNGYQPTMESGDILGHEPARRLCHDFKHVRAVRPIPCEREGSRESRHLLPGVEALFFSASAISSPVSRSWGSMKGSPSAA